MLTDMRVVWSVATCVVACASALSSDPARVGDVVIHGPRKEHHGQWGTLASPEGIEVNDETRRSTTSFVASLLSSMRLPVPAVDSVHASDYVSVEDPFNTRGAQVAALFTVLERPDLSGIPRMKDAGSFTHKLDALSTVHQMLTGFIRSAGSEKEIPTIADLVPGKTVSLSGDFRYAKAAGKDATVIEPSMSTDVVAAAWSSAPVFERYAKKLETSDPAISFLVAELAAAVHAVNDETFPKYSFVNVVVTGLAVVDESAYAVAQSMVDEVLVHCADILTKRTENTAFVQMVTVIDERVEVDRDVGHLVNGAMEQVDDKHRVALPHVYTPYWTNVGILCDKIDKALVNSDYTVDCPKGHPQRQGAAVNSRRRAELENMSGGSSSDYDEPNLWVWQFQIFFWLTVMFVVVILVVSTQIAGLDPGYNSIIYRMTPGQGH